MAVQGLEVEGESNGIVGTLKKCDSTLGRGGLELESVEVLFLEARVLPPLKITEQQRWAFGIQQPLGRGHLSPATTATCSR